MQASNQQPSPEPPTEKEPTMTLLFIPSLAAVAVIGAIWLRDYFGSKGNV